MLDESVALTADLDDVKGALEKAIPAGRAQRFERNAFSASEFVRPENRTMSLSENEAFARRALFKQIRDGDPHRLCNPVQQVVRRVYAHVLTLGQLALGAPGHAGILHGAPGWEAAK